MNQMSFISLAFSKQVVTRAIKVALIVGTLLALINHGERLFAMSLTGQDYFKVILTYFVPYAVSTWSAVSAIRSPSTSHT